jgi:dihydrodipicolinate synthase/N-acetylneuraminate lyase
VRSAPSGSSRRSPPRRLELVFLWALFSNGRGTAQIMIRFKRTILATCCVPWDARSRFDESLFRETVGDLLAHGLNDLYVFGTAGEGHAVGDDDYRRVVDAFLDELSVAGQEPMVGVISLSLRTVIERIEYAAERGCRLFQISLPFWGAVNDREIDAFFEETCGRFPDLRFLHYNLLRAGRLIKPAEYAALSEMHPNLVATKYGGGDPEIVTGLLERASALRHFLTEPGFYHGSAVGECALLASISIANPARARRYFEAGTAGDRALISSLYAELARMLVKLREVVGEGPHLDGAFDKIVSRLRDDRFPLRLIGPWQASDEMAFSRYRDFLRSDFPQWLPTASTP